MTDVNTDESASAGPVDATDFDTDALPHTLDEQGNDEIVDLEKEEPESPEGDEDDGLVEWTDEETGKTYRVPPKVRESEMLKADHTRKTMSLAEERKAVIAQQETVRRQQERQAEFAGQIAQLGALNAKLEPFAQVQDWPSYLRQGGSAAQADYAEYQALTNQRDQFARNLGAQVQQRDAELQRETVEQIEAGRQEIAKCIKGYGPETLDKLVAFATPLGFSPDEIRQAEADPRSIRILHLAMLGQQLLSQRKRTDVLAQGQKTRPAPTLRGAGSAPVDPRRMGPAEMAKHLGY